MAGARREHDFAALGLAAFGPLDLRADSPRYGWVATTVKAGWSDTELLGRFARRYRTPTAIDTDVNAAALAEARWGGAQGLGDFAYVTVGTGIGAGVMVNGRPVRGANHAEVGHIRIVRTPGDDFPGICPFHGDCVEGLAAGPAIRARARREVAELARDDAIWAHVAHPLAQLCQALVLTTGPRRIFFGGGVMLHQPQLFGMIREGLQTQSERLYRDPGARRGIGGFHRPRDAGRGGGAAGGTRGGRRGTGKW